MPDADGLYFDRYGSVISAGRIPDEPEETYSLEVWVQPAARKPSATILGFCAPETLHSFHLAQIHDDLVLEGDAVREENRVRISWIEIPHAFRLNAPLLITVTSGKYTAVYLDGVLAKTAQFRFVRSGLAGQLVLGTSPAVDQGWVGKLRGLAFYDRELTPEEVTLHHLSWMGKGPRITGATHLYRFDERSGDRVHDASNPGIDLRIPPRYTILKPPFLESPVKAFRNNWSYWKDVLINIGGFIPFGFLFGIYFSLMRPTPRPKLTTILCGAAVSLLIEITQVFLPTRDSSMTDVLMNTLGTTLGVLLQSCTPAWSLYRRILMPASNRRGSV